MRPGKALAAILRPGNAGSNTAADHFTVLGLALEQYSQDVDREILVAYRLRRRDARVHR